MSQYDFSKFKHYKFRFKKFFTDTYGTRYRLLKSFWLFFGISLKAESEDTILPGSLGYRTNKLKITVLYGPKQSPISKGIPYTWLLYLGLV